MTTNHEVLVRIYQMPDERGVLGWRAIEFGTANMVTNPTDPRYKDPSAPGAMPGQRLGVMAQDLEKSPLGDQFDLVVEVFRLRRVGDMGIDAGVDDRCHQSRLHSSLHRQALER